MLDPSYPDYGGGYQDVADFYRNKPTLVFDRESKKGRVSCSAMFDRKSRRHSEAPASQMQARLRIAV